MDPTLELFSGPLLPNASATQHPLLHSVLLVLATLVVVWVVRVIWPSASLPEPAWTVDTPARAREHLRRLILPTDAITLREPVTSADAASSGTAPSRRSTLGSSASVAHLPVNDGAAGAGCGVVIDGAAADGDSPGRRSNATVVQRMSSEAARLVSAGLRTPGSRTPAPPPPKPNPHAFVFDHSAPSAHECTPLLVFVNPASGGRHGQAALTRLRSLLSEHQVVDLTLGQSHVDEALASFRTVGRFRVSRPAARTPARKTSPRHLCGSATWRTASPPRSTPTPTANAHSRGTSTRALSKTRASPMLLRARVLVSHAAQPARAIADTTQPALLLQPPTRTPFPTRRYSYAAAMGRSGGFSRQLTACASTTLPPSPSSRWVCSIAKPAFPPAVCPSCRIARTPWLQCEEKAAFRPRSLFPSHGARRHRQRPGSRARVGWRPSPRPKARG